MRQGELFGRADLAQPAPGPAEWPAPIPERIRPKLERRLIELRRAAALGWPDWEVKAMTDHFTAMADRLGPEESAEWVARWRAEMARLEAAPGSRRTAA